MNLLRDFSFDECFSPVLEPEEETTSFLLSYIQENYDKYSLQQMADSLHYNPNYLSGLIREKNRHELYAACAQFPDDRSKKNASGHKRSDREHCPAGRLYKSGYFYQSFQKRNRHDAYALSPAKPKLLRASF